MEYFKIKNNQTTDLDKIPVLSYASFNLAVYNLLLNESFHCVNYFAYPQKDRLKFICCIADDPNGDIYLFSFETKKESKEKLIALNKEIIPLHVFEREIHETHGVSFAGHQWLKPIRYPYNRFNQSSNLTNYPFFKIDGMEIHEVGVGPIHAGIIEPGHFRFMCHGEKIAHLEIQLGYQHRGIETLFIEKKSLLQKTIVAESIAGDSVVGHTLTFANNMESLMEYEEDSRLSISRAIALELERIAIHVGDLSALCVDVAYQLGSAVFGGLRTPLINFFQLWCGNRFAKGLIRPGYNPWPLTDDLIEKLLATLNAFEARYTEMADLAFVLPSVLTRFQNTGQVSKEQASLIGTVGMAARSSGIKRDIRSSHPFNYYKHLKYQTTVLDSGDVWARGKLRDLEIRKSLEYIRSLITQLSSFPKEASVNGFKNHTHLLLKPNQFSISMTEGWRGEICHCAISDEKGELILYKVKDPSLHNWMALALSVRDNEISDFPICNKSYNLSYCGNDL